MIMKIVPWYGDIRKNEMRNGNKAKKQGVKALLFLSRFVII